MKHASTHALYAYWNERRGSRAAPERVELEPRDIGRALADTFILTFDASAAHPFRLAGTHICGLFGRELRGDPFESLWATEDRPLVRSLLHAVADEASGVVAGVRGKNEEGDPLELELLLLPLRHRGRTHARLTGVLAPLATPFWLGSSPLLHLNLIAHRHLAAAEVAPQPTPFTIVHGGAGRASFVVHEGGLS